MEIKCCFTGKMNERKGVGVMIDEVMKTTIVEVIKKINWIIVVKLVLEASIMNVISKYVPQVGYTRNEKNLFWQDMDKNGSDYNVRFV